MPKSKHPPKEPPLVSGTFRSTLHAALLTWYDGCKRPLLWRVTKDPYAVWVSEVMLQQTQVKTVEGYYRRFMARFPDIAALAKADLQTVLTFWQGLGYYSRGRNLHRAAQMIQTERGGNPPTTWEEWHQLPGVGDYIASAVVSIALGGTYAVVDGNVKRVLARLFRIAHPIDGAGAHRLFQETADRVLDHRRPGDYNQALMELGALICTPRAPRCEACPLRKFCGAAADGSVSRFPMRRAKKALPHRTAVAARIVRGGRLLLVQRPGEGLLGGMWELPGGELLPEETPLEACRRTLGDRLALELKEVRTLGVVRHTYTHFKLQLTVLACARVRGALRPGEGITARWVRPADLAHYPLHKAALKALALDDGFEPDKAIDNTM